MLAGMAGLIWSFGAFLSRVEDDEAAPKRHAEGAVALTGGADRITDAIELLAQGSADRLLITGVNPMTSRAEIAKLVPGTRHCSAAASNSATRPPTRSAMRPRPNDGCGPTISARSIVVTSNYHMPRALAEIGSALPDIDLIAFPVVSERGRSRPWWSDPQSTRLIVSEYVQICRRGRAAAADAAQAGTDRGSRALAAVLADAGLVPRPGFPGRPRFGTSTAMLVLRSALFNLLFYLNLLALMVLGLPGLAGPAGRHAPVGALGPLLAVAAEGDLRHACRIPRPASRARRAR